MTKNADGVVTMTQRDWETVQKAYDLQQRLLHGMEAAKNMRGPARAKEAKKLMGHAHSYDRFLKDPKNSSVLVRCFGDEELVMELKEMVSEFKRRLKAAK